jgi:DNA polymerase-1
MCTDEIDLRPYEIIDIETKVEASVILNKLINAELLAVDIETDGFGFIDNRLGTLQICGDGITGYFFDWGIIDKRLLRKVLQTAERITGANGKFDAKFIWKNGVKGWDFTDDVSLLSHAINSNRPKGLKPLAIFYAGKFTGYDLELDKAKKQLKVDNYLQIPKTILKKYSALDAIVSWRVQKALDNHVRWIDKHIPNEKIPEWTIERWYRDVMMPNVKVVTDVEYEGVYFNNEQFDISSKIIQEKIKELKEKLAKEWNVSVDFEFESTKQLGQLFKKMGWPELELSKLGEFKTSDPLLTEYERLKMPGIKLLKELRSYNVGMGTFIEGWKKFLYKHEDGTYRIHPNCNAFGTESFRHAMKNPNFQQIPNSSKIASLIKKLFTNPPPIEYIKITDNNGKIWTNEYTDLVETDRGIISFDQLEETDNIRRYIYGDK